MSSARPSSFNILDALIEYHAYPDNLLSAIAKAVDEGFEDREGILALCNLVNLELTDPLSQNAFQNLLETYRAGWNTKSPDVFDILEDELYACLRILRDVLQGKRLKRKDLGIVVLPPSSFYVPREFTGYVTPEGWLFNAKDCKNIISLVQQLGHGRYSSTLFTLLPLGRRCDVIHNEQGTFAICPRDKIHLPGPAIQGFELAFHLEEKRWVFIKSQKTLETHTAILQGLQGKSPGLVMPYPKGNSLNSIIEEGGLPASMRLEIAIWALEYLRDEIHEKGFFHCNITTANIFFNKATQKVMIAHDGSTVRRMTQKDGTYAPTVMVQRRGTAGYIAPDYNVTCGMRHDDKGLFSAKADVHSLGVTLETLFGSNMVAAIDGQTTVGTGKLKNILNDMQQHSEKERPTVDQCIHYLESVYENYTQTNAGQKDLRKAASIQQDAENAEERRLNRLYRQAQAPDVKLGFLGRLQKAWNVVFSGLIKWSGIGAVLGGIVALTGGGTALIPVPSPSAPPKSVFPLPTPRGGPVPVAPMMGPSSPLTLFSVPVTSPATSTPRIKEFRR